MLMVLLIMAIVAMALIIGAVWGAYWTLPKPVEGFLVALAGGALIVSVVEELIQPAEAHAPLWAAMSVVALGAVTFTGLDWLVDRAFGGAAGGFGLLIAITLDGTPENLALGVALIGSEPLAVAALAGSIVLSNLPEAAGGARAMKSDGRSPMRVVLIWTLTAGILSAATVAGYTLLTDAPDIAIGLIKCFAAGAIVASLATEVFPKAFKEDHLWSGIAVALGLITAHALGQLG